MSSISLLIVKTGKDTAEHDVEFMHNPPCTALLCSPDISERPLSKCGTGHFRGVKKRKKREPIRLEALLL